MKKFTSMACMRRALTLASLALGVSIGATGILPTIGAIAAPIAAVNSAAAQSGAEGGVMLVRDGCGRGMRFSNSRQACVPQGGGGPVYVDPGAAIVQGIIGGVVGATRPGCPRGTRWSNRRGGCVYY